MSPNQLHQKKYPAFSVVIPWYRDRTQLRRSVKSAASQTYTAEEIIVVCNGPGIGEATSISEEFRDLEPPIVVLSCAEAHANVARNLGLRHAKGSHVAFLDADDEFVPNKLATVAKHVLSKSSEVIICSGGVRVRANGKRWSFATIAKTEFETIGQYIIVNGNFLLTSGFIVPASIVQHVCFDVSTPKFQDLDFLLRAEAAGYEIEIIPQPLYIYHDEESDHRISRGRNADADVSWAKSHPNIDEQLYRAFCARFISQHVFPKNFSHNFFVLWKGHTLGKISANHTIAMIIRGLIHPKLRNFLFESYGKIRQSKASK